MTQFKDKSARAGADRVTVGLYTYPILMAADVLLYQANYVPVGEDQRQHLELTRTLANRFNTQYGDTFVVPEPYILRSTAKIYDLQVPTAKMSKSLPDAGTVSLLDDPAVIVRKFRRAVTDTGSEIRYDLAEKPGVSNLLAVLAAFTDRPIDDLEREYAGAGYGAFKTAVADAVVAFAEPFAARTNELLGDRAELDRILRRGTERARRVAAETVRAAYERVGLVPASDAVVVG